MAATAATPPVWPVSGSPTGSPVARSHTRTVASSLPVTTTGRPSEPADGHRRHQAGVAGQRRPDRLAGGQIPHPHRGVPAAGDRDGRPSSSPTATAATSRTTHRAGVAGQRFADRFAGAQIPHPHRASWLPVTATGGPSQLADGHRQHRAGVAGQRRPDRLAGAQSHTRTVASSRR